MTDSPPDRPTPESEQNDQPEPGHERKQGPTFLEWLDEKGITATGEPKPQPAPESSSPDEPPPLPPDIRAGAWTIPLGLAWLTGSYIVPQLTTHSTGTLPRILGVALIAYTISAACELSLAYSLRSAYPALGMWTWATHPRIARAFNHGTETVSKAGNNGGCFTLLAACALPAMFAAFYIFSKLLTIAIPLWVTLMTATTVTHVAVTIARLRRKGKR